MFCVRRMALGGMGEGIVGSIGVLAYMWFIKDSFGLDCIGKDIYHADQETEAFSSWHPTA